MILLTVIGARPQFVKAAFVHRALVGLEVPRLQHLIIHTGQHFDENMSGTFFREFDLPQPDWNLGVHGGSHGEMTGRMLCLLEPLMQSTRPDMVAVYGDTNSTLAAALVAAKLHLRIAHIEAGLRSFNRRMPLARNARPIVPTTATY